MKVERAMSHYLRVEGVNLGHFVFDTRDLSTIRGGSLLLLQAIPKVETVLRASGLVGAGNFRTISQGASSGLFELDVDQAQASQVAQLVRSALEEDPIFCHATFVVDVVAAPDGNPGFRAVTESALAANHWRQMQGSSLAIPQRTDTQHPGPPACSLNGVLPAATDANHSVRGKQISNNVRARREYGREAKERFYLNWTGEQNLPDFVQDFEKLSQGMPELDGKMAVFYADGNKFGQIQAEHCNDVIPLKAWDRYIRGSRKQFLTDFLVSEVMPANSKWLNEGKARFETLLWGGDEVMFVMPAALGWRFATLFFKAFAGLNLSDAFSANSLRQAFEELHPNPPPSAGLINGGAPPPDLPLTHAAALVFCQHHCPIHRVRTLAKEQMAEYAKELDRHRDSLVVAILESFDHLGTSYKVAMERRYGNHVPLQHMIFSGQPVLPLHDKLRQFSEKLGALRGSPTFSRSQLRRNAEEIIKGRTLSNPRTGLSIEETDSIEGLTKLFHSEAIMWVQLEELWDYAL
jgi:hypothetical protein